MCSSNSVLCLSLIEPASSCTVCGEALKIKSLHFVGSRARNVISRLERKSDYDKKGCEIWNEAGGHGCGKWSNTRTELSICFVFIHIMVLAVTKCAMKDIFTVNSYLRPLRSYLRTRLKDVSHEVSPPESFTMHKHNAAPSLKRTTSRISLRRTASRKSLLGSITDGVAPPHRFSSFKLSLDRRRSSVMSITLILCILGLFALSLVSRWRPIAVWSSRSNAMTLPKYLQAQTYLAGPPTTNFRSAFCPRTVATFINIFNITDSLRNDTAYLTSWLSAGWSTYIVPNQNAYLDLTNIIFARTPANDVMTIVSEQKLIHIETWPNRNDPRIAPRAT